MQVLVFGAAVSRFHESISVFMKTFIEVFVAEAFRVRFSGWLTLLLRRIHKLSCIIRCFTTIGVSNRCHETVVI